MGNNSSTPAKASPPSSSPPPPRTSPSPSRPSPPQGNRQVKNGQTPKQASQPEAQPTANVAKPQRKSKDGTPKRHASSPSPDQPAAAPSPSPPPPPPPPPPPTIPTTVGGGEPPNSNKEPNPYLPRLIAYYEKHNPAKIPDAEYILDDWKGDEKKLFKILKSIYEPKVVLEREEKNGAENPQQHKAEADHDGYDSVLSTYRGSIDGRTYRPRTAMEEQMTYKDWFERFNCFFHKYDESRLYLVGAMLEKSKGHEHITIQRLVERYGPEPPPWGEMLQNDPFIVPVQPPLYAYEEVEPHTIPDRNTGMLPVIYAYEEAPPMSARYTVQTCSPHPLSIEEEIVYPYFRAQEEVAPHTPKNSPEFLYLFEEERVEKFPPLEEVKEDEGENRSCEPETAEQPETPVRNSTTDEESSVRDGNHTAFEFTGSNVREFVLERKKRQWWDSTSQSPQKKQKASDSRKKSGKPESDTRVTTRVSAHPSPSQSMKRESSATTPFNHTFHNDQSERESSAAQRQPSSGLVDDAEEVHHQFNSRGHSREEIQDLRRIARKQQGMLLERAKENERLRRTLYEETDMILDKVETPPPPTRTLLTPQCAIEGEQQVDKAHITEVKPNDMNQQQDDHTYDEDNFKEWINGVVDPHEKRHQEENSCKKNSRLNDDAVEDTCASSTSPTVHRQNSLHRGLTHPYDPVKSKSEKRAANGISQNRKDVRSHSPLPRQTSFTEFPVSSQPLEKKDSLRPPQQGAGNVETSDNQRFLYGYSPAQSNEHSTNSRRQSSQSQMMRSVEENMKVLKLLEKKHSKAQNSSNGRLLEELRDEYEDSLSSMKRNNQKAYV